MIWLVVLLSLLVATLAFLLVISVMLNKKLSDFAVRFEENYTEAQDALDKMHASLDIALSYPVTIDDPVTTRILAEMKACRSEVIRVARLVSMQDEESDAERTQDDRE